MKKQACCVVVLVTVMTACKIPDLKPFSDATAQMATALKQGFERSRASLSAATETAGDQSTFKAHLTKLDAEWKPTRQALSALVAYSDALAALAEAGKKGPETMARLTGAIGDLAQAVSAIPIPSAGVEIVNKVGAKLIEMQASRDIRKAVDAAGDAIEIVAPILKATFADLRVIHGAAGRAYASRVQAESSIVTNYYESVHGEQQRLEYLLNLMIDYLSAPARLRWRAAIARANSDEALAARLLASIDDEQRDLLQRIEETDSAFENLDVEGDIQAADVEARQLQLMALLTAQRKELAILEPRYTKARERESGIRDAWLAGDRVLATAGEAIDAWLKAHKSLRAAAQGSQSRPSVADLLSITDELKSLVN
jgi:hypothetical protein